MSNFTTLPMAKEVAKHPSLSQSRGFLGYFKHTFYAPTGSMLQSYSNYYKESDARLFKQLIETPSEKLLQYVPSLQEVDDSDESNFRLDICVSQDGQFMAMQLNHVDGEAITHITPIRYFEGKEALTVDSIF